MTLGMLFLLLMMMGIVLVALDAVLPANDTGDAALAAHNARDTVPVVHDAVLPANDAVLATHDTWDAVLVVLVAASIFT